MLESGSSIAEIISSKGVSPSTIHKWRHELNSGVEWHDIPTVKERAQEKEIEYYKKKVAELTRDVDLLKKIQEEVSQRRKELSGSVITVKNWDPKRKPVK